MAKNNEVTAKFSVDIAELKKGITEANRQIRMANAEFKAASAGMQDWQKSSDGLTAKITQLKSVLSSQKTILENLKKQYEQVAAEQGENSKGAQELAIKIKNQEAAINKTTKELNNFEGELKDVQKAEDLAAKNGKSVEENLREIGEQGKQTADDMKKSSEGFTVLKGVLADLAVSGIKMAIGAMKELATETWESVKAAAAYADEINTLSAQTGLSTEKLQEFKYMEDLLDVSTDTLTGSMAKLIRNMANAQKGTGDASAAFEALGVSVTDSSGELRSNQDVFGEVIDALGQMENETQRDAYAMQIFGKSAQDLNPLIKAGGDRIAELSEEAHKMGYVLGDETLDSLNETQDSFDRLSKVAEGTKNNLVAAFGPVITEVLKPFTEALAEVPAAVKSGDFSGVLGAIKGIFTGALNKAKEEGPAFIKSGFEIAKQIGLGILEATPDVANVAAELLKAGIEGITEQAPQIINALPETFKQIAGVLIRQVPAILNAGNGLALALVQTVASAMPGLVSEMPGFLQTVADAIIAFLPVFLQSGADILQAVIDGIIATLPVLLAALPEVINTISGLLEESLPIIIEAATSMLLGIIKALPTIIQLLIRNLPNIITTITNVLVKSIPILIEASETLFEKGIIPAIPYVIRLLVQDLPNIINTITMTLIANTPLVLAAAIELFTGIISAIPQICISLAKEVPTIIETIVQGLIENIDSMRQAGIDLIAGLWEGMSGSTDWIKERIAGWVGNVTDFMKGLFGIHSPSTIMRDLIGKNIALGIAEGITENENAIKEAMGDVNADLIGSVDVRGARNAIRNGVTSAGGNGATGSAGGRTQNVTNNFYQYNTSPKALSRLEIYRQTRNQLAALGG